jgi:hypothetical protein
MDLSGMHFLSDLFAAGHVRSERYTIVVAWKIAAAKIFLNKVKDFNPIAKQDIDIILNKTRIFTPGQIDALTIK